MSNTKDSLLPVLTLAELRQIVRRVRDYYPSDVFPPPEAGKPCSIDQTSGEMARRTCDNILSEVEAYIAARGCCEIGRKP